MRRTITLLSTLIILLTILAPAALAARARHSPRSSRCLTALRRRVAGVAATRST